MMTIEFLDIAKVEFDEAMFFYELEQDGLGERFKAEVRRAIDRMLQFPDSWPVERGEVRKCFVHTFPYKILYAIDHERLVILAVAHQHREPDYWIARFTEKE
jgi:toxin ParE2